MASRGIVGRALRTRWCRAVAVLGACALAVQSAQLPLLGSAQAATCCCPQRTAGDVCGCPVCAHRRELECSQPVLKTCGARAPAAAIAAPDAAVPPPRGAHASRSAPAAAVPLVASPPPEPALDVPTPPPLARG